MAENDEIESYEVSEDGLTWRPYDPARDSHKRLHRRIVFGPASETDNVSPAGRAKRRAGLTRLA